MAIVSSSFEMYVVIASQHTSRDNARWEQADHLDGVPIHDSSF